MAVLPIHLKDDSSFATKAKNIVINSGRKFKVFLDVEGSQDYYEKYNAPDVAIDSIPMEEFRVDFIKDTFLRLESSVDLSFEYVNSYLEANMRLMLVSDDTYKPGGRESSRYESGTYFSEVTFKAGKYRTQGSNWWQHVIAHEICHGLLLEHPFEGRDGDSYGSEYSTSVDETIMAYGSPSVWGRYHSWLTEVDEQALQSIWGTPEGYSPEFRGERYSIAKNYRLDLIKDFDGNLHGGAEHDSVKNSYFAQGNADINNDGDLETIFTNSVSGRWASVNVTSFSKTPDYDDFGESGETRIVGIYDDPLVLSGEVEAGSPHDSQVRFQNDLYNDNLRLGSAADVDSDGFGEVFWKTTDGSAFLRSIHHLDGNVKYANYMNAGQMTDYLSQHGHMGDIGSSLGL